MAAGGGQLGGVQRAVQGEGGLQILDLAPQGCGAGEHTSLINIKKFILNNLVFSGRCAA